MHVHQYSVKYIKPPSNSSETAMKVDNQGTAFNHLHFGKLASAS